jgi:COMPASS component SWD3
VSGSEDKKVYIWDLQTREIVQTLEGHDDIVVAVAVSLALSLFYYNSVLKATSIQTHPQQNMIASGSIESDTSIRIWVEPVASSSAS